MPRFFRLNGFALSVAVLILLAAKASYAHPLVINLNPVPPEASSELERSVGSTSQFGWYRELSLYDLNKQVVTTPNLSIIDAIYQYALGYSLPTIRNVHKRFPGWHVDAAISVMDKGGTSAKEFLKISSSYKGTTFYGSSWLAANRVRVTEALAIRASKNFHPDPRAQEDQAVLAAYKRIQLRKLSRLQKTPFARVNIFLESILHRNTLTEDAVPVKLALAMYKWWQNPTLDKDLPLASVKESICVEAVESHRTQLVLLKELA